MAKETIITDDLDGSRDASTVSFGLEGQNYEIDLSQKNLDKLRGALAPFIDGGARKVSRTKGLTTRATKGTDFNQNERAAIRQWAKDNGLTVSERGKLSAEIVQAYTDAH